MANHDVVMSVTETPKNGTLPPDEGIILSPLELNVNANDTVTFSAHQSLIEWIRSNDYHVKFYWNDVSEILTLDSVPIKKTIQAHPNVDSFLLEIIDSTQSNSLSDVGNKSSSGKIIVK